MKTNRPEFGAPGSFSDIAFDAGVIWARHKAFNDLMGYRLNQMNKGNIAIANAIELAMDMVLNPADEVEADNEQDR